MGDERGGQQQLQNSQEGGQQSACSRWWATC